jgi:serine phosphatase RsbU (regulator of sigma subunit)/Tfp pilus assembly protein PilF
LICILVSKISLGQNIGSDAEYIIDSLKYVIESSKEDTIIVNAYTEWDNIIYASDPALDLELNEKILSICNKNLESGISGKRKDFFQSKKGNSLNNIGLIHRYAGNTEKSLDFFKKSIELEEELGNTEGIARSLNNIGLVYSDIADIENALKYFDQSMEKYIEVESISGQAMVNNNIGIIYYEIGDITKALDYYFEELKLEEQVGNKDGIASSLNNLAILYSEQGDTNKGFEYFKKVRDIRIEIGDQHGIASSTNNLGLLYFQNNQYDTALKYYLESVKIYKNIGNKVDLGGTYSNIAQVYQKKEKFNKAIEYGLLSLELLEEVNLAQGIAQTTNTLGLIYLEMGEIKKAKEMVEKSLYIAKEIGYPLQLQNAAKALSMIFEQEGQGMKALEMHKLFISMKDSIQNEKLRNTTIKQQAKYEYEKQKAIDDSEHEKQIAIEEEKQEKQKVIIYTAAGGLLLLVVFIVFIINRLNVTRQQKNEINTQKEEIAFQHEQLEQTHTEIKDSITYAKRLQNAILPSIKDITKHIPHNFIYFKPKDVVSGDFYWFERVEQTIFVAAADCTGHGVPGAMVSVVCSNALNRAVKEFNLKEPADILNKTRDLVVEQFSMSGEEIKDGMDISLCAFNGNKMTYSGANNPIWIVKNTEKLNQLEKENKGSIINEERSIVELKGDRKPIGKYRDMSPFSQKEMILEEGNLIYLFSDGFSDQFGGESLAGKVGGKKFKYKPFKNFLLSINQMPLDEQKEHIDRTFNLWKGDFEQVDDVCIIGLKF